MVYGGLYVMADSIWGGLVFGLLCGSLLLKTGYIVCDGLEVFLLFRRRLPCLGLHSSAVFGYQPRVLPVGLGSYLFGFSEAFYLAWIDYAYGVFLS